MQLLVRRHAAGTYDIGKKFFAVLLGDQALSDLGTAVANRSDYDLRILFLKIRQHLFVTADVNRNLAFLLGRFESFFPLPLLTRLRFPSATDVREEQNRCYDTDEKRNDEVKKGRVTVRQSCTPISIFSRRRLCRNVILRY